MTDISDTEKRYFSIGEVSRLCGVAAHTLRHWEGRFEQLRPVKRKGNRRFYSKANIQLVRRLQYLLYERGMTTEGVRRYFRVNQKGLELELLESELASLEQQMDVALAQFREGS